MRKMFLGWWCEEVDDLWLWCLALACEKCGVTLHQATRVGNHYHIMFTVSEENLGDFFRWLNRSLSSGLKALLRRHGYAAPDEIFDGQGTHAMRLLDAEAQLAHLVYERVNCVQAGLAATCDTAPGGNLPLGYWKTGGRRVKKPEGLFPGESAELHLPMAPPALAYLGAGGDVESLLHHIGRMERICEREIGKLRGPARTASEVRSIDPWSEPKTWKDERGSAPCFKTRLGKEARTRAAREVRAWRRAYRDAATRWRSGERDVAFPHGTYQMRRMFGVEVAEPGADSWVSAPGLTLAEARECVHERDPSLMDRVQASVLEALRETEMVEAEAERDDRTSDADDEPSSRPSAPDHHRSSLEIGRPGTGSVPTRPTGDRDPPRD
ncbi:MAG: hypothetical protein CMN30_20770 [Sandaracinus sp.]|nr:hypothetical protein [Sandaracinus sp.]